MNLKDINHIQEAKRLILMLLTLIHSFYLLSYRVQRFVASLNSFLKFYKLRIKT